MPATIQSITAALYNWLCSNGIEPSDVKLTIEFPNAQTAHEARCCVLRDLEPLMQFPAFDTVKTVHGIALDLTYRNQK